mgnify:CR=1 FL=1
MFTNNILPLELIEIILSYINDNSTYRKCRLVNREWYNLLKNLKNFDFNGIYTSRIEFTPEYIRCILVNEKIKYEYKLNRLGNNVYREYNDRGMIIKRVNVELPNYIYFYTLENNVMNTKTFNIKTNNQTSSSTPLYPFNPNCSIM